MALFVLQFMSRTFTNHEKGLQLLIRYSTLCQTQGALAFRLAHKIFNCLTKSTNTINKMKNQMKRRTNYDTKVDYEYNNVDNDWP